MVATPNTPYGLRRIQRTGSAGYRDSLTPFRIAAADTNAYFVGDPIVRLTNSGDATGRQAVTLATAGSGHPLTGVVCGFLPIYASLATPGPMYRPGAAQTQDWIALCSTDPGDEYMIQENDDSGGVAGTPLPVTAVGKNISLIAAAGSPYTGWSGWMADANTVADAAAAQLTILGFAIEPDNTPGAAYAKIVVRINNSTEAPGVAGV